MSIEPLMELKNKCLCSRYTHQSGKNRIEKKCPN